MLGERMLVSPAMVVVAAGGGGVGGSTPAGPGRGGDAGPAADALATIAIVAVFVGVAGWVLVGLWKRVGTLLVWRRRARRSGSLERALAAMSEIDPSFDPQALVPEVERLAVQIQEAWDGRDRERLRLLVDTYLMRDWEQRLDRFDASGWHSRWGLRRRVRVAVVGVANRAGEAEDRVVVYVRAPALSWIETPEGRRFEPGRFRAQTTLSQYWTLVRSRGRWVLGAVETEEEGRHHLTDAVVTAPELDPTLEDRARLEVADGDRPGTTTAGTLVSTAFADDARAAALDRSLVDDRFSPDVLAATVREAVKAWMAATEGSRAGLEHRATPGVVYELLDTDDGQRSRTVLRGVRVDEVTVESLDDVSDPATVIVRIDYRARWYREIRSTQVVVEGSRERLVSRTEHWTFELDRSRETVWRVVGVQRAPDPDSSVIRRAGAATGKALANNTASRILMGITVLLGAVVLWAATHSIVGVVVGLAIGAVIVTWQVRAREAE